jgi:hypothetical protein
LKPILVNIDRLFMLTAPLFLELGRREVAQRGVDTLVHVDVVQEPAQLEHSIIITHVIRQVNLPYSLVSGQSQVKVVGMWPEAVLWFSLDVV